MAVRPIDAAWLKRNLNKVFPRECDQLYGMLQLIDEAPTLTPPNEPPRWTEQDKEDARKIKAIFPDDYSLDVSRLDDGRLKLVIIQSLSFILINDELLPSLKPGESATLYEIIGEEE